MRLILESWRCHGILKLIDSLSTYVGRASVCLWVCARTTSLLLSLAHASNGLVYFILQDSQQLPLSMEIASLSTWATALHRESCRLRTCCRVSGIGS